MFFDVGGGLTLPWFVGVGDGGFFPWDDAMLVGSGLECSGGFSDVADLVGWAFYVVDCTGFVQVVDWVLSLCAQGVLDRSGWFVDGVDVVLPVEPSYLF